MIAKNNTKKPYFNLNFDENCTNESMPVIEKYFKDWNKYLLDFLTATDVTSLPFDNEMSATGSFSSAVTRHNKDCFVVHEAVVHKRGNQATNSGRCDLWIYSTKNQSAIYFEAKRHRKIITTKEELVNAFSKDEKTDNTRSLLGKGFRDFTKTTGKVHRIRKKGRVMMLLAHLQLSDEFDRDHVIDMLRTKVFNKKIIIRKTNETKAEIGKKNMSNFPTIGFIFTPKDNPHQTLLATMTLV